MQKFAITSSGALLLFGIGGAWYVAEARHGAGWLPWVTPMLAFSIIAIVALLGLVKAAAGAVTTPDGERFAGMAKLVGAYGLLTAGVLAIPLTGITLSGIFVLLALAWLMGERRVLALLAITVIPPLVIHLIARFVLRVPWA